jgi:putative PIN family toxin of toxin-antitoxin system
LRVVLDTNVLVSALLFRGGRLHWIRRAWQASDPALRLTPVLAPATTRELIRVLGYPKFQLSAQDVHDLLADLLPFAETLAADPPPIGTVDTLRDESDRIFLDVAMATGAEALVSGDADLLALAGTMVEAPILSPAQFEEWWRERQNLG